MRSISGYVVSKVLGSGKKVVRLKEVISLIGQGRPVGVAKAVINNLNQKGIRVVL